jgi:hypothetical protein
MKRFGTWPSIVCRKKYRADELVIAAIGESPEPAQRVTRSKTSRSFCGAKFK